MIPADLTARLRALIDLPLPEVRPVTPARATPDDHLPPGTRFTAQVLEKLPDGNFRALVADRPVTLSLPQQASPGQVLQLVVSRTTAQAVFAQPAPATPLAEPSAKPQLSQVGQLVSQFASGELGKAEPVMLKGGTPLLPAPPGPGTGAAQIAPELVRAVTTSGVFYESHQAQWAAGQLPLEQLQQEPQAQIASKPVLPHAGATPAEQGATNQTADMLPQAVRAAQDSAATRTAANATQPSTADTKSALLDTLVQREAAPVVLQQLDSLLNQQLAWQGVVWPGQTMQWTVDLPEREGGGGSDGEAASDWNTTLKLTMPRLGEVEARLHLTPAGLALRIEATDASTVEHLEGGIEKLSSALEAHGIPLTGHAIVKHADA
jgi:hypothetical protein